MTRVLVFDGPRAAKRFELLRVALFAAGDGKGERTREIVRAEARLLDALDTVSTATPDAGDPDARTLIAGAAPTVAISQPDCDRLTQYVDTTPWTPRTARDAVDLQDWLSAAEKVD